jgi:hypothetical protein
VFAAQLGHARFRQVSAIDESAGGRVLARFSGGSAALVEYQSGRGRIIVLASDLSNRGNDLPLQPTFVPLVHETLRYLGSRRALPVEYVIAEAPPELPREPGFRTLGEGGRRVTVNVDAAESEFVKMTEAEFTSAISRISDAGASEARDEARETEGQQSYWRYGLSLMLLALVAEGVLGRRLG